MRNFLVFLLTSAVGLGFLTSPGAAQDPTKKIGDPNTVLNGLFKSVRQKDNVEERIAAIVALADFGPRAAPALNDLLDALQTKNEDLRLNAAITLAKIGKAAVKPVAELLRAKDADTKFYAISVIGWMGPDAKETVPVMLKLMADKEEAVRRKAAHALGRLGGDPDETIGVLVAAFKDDSDDVREAAGEALAKLGKVAVRPLIDLLKLNDAKARKQAATSLGDIGADAKDALPLLQERFLAKDSEGAQHYALVLAKLGKAALPALTAGFKDARADVRTFAAEALAQLGADAVPILLDGLGDKNVEVRRLSAQTLWPMQIGDKSVVLAFAFALGDEDEAVRQFCINGLVTLGAQAKLGSAKIKEALTDRNEHVRVQAYYLLSSFGEDLKPTMQKALLHKDVKVRINTACLMVSVNYQRNDAIPILVDALKSDERGLKMQAALTLAQHQLQTDKVLPLFVDGLKDKSAEVRVQAVNGLGMLQKGAGAAAPALAEMLRDGDANVRQHAISALQNVVGKAEAVVPILTKIFKEGDAGIRANVLQVAWLYGGKAMSLLIDGLKDKNADVRQQAVNSLRYTQEDLPDLAPTIIALMKEKGQPLRHQLVWLLWQTGEAGVPHLGELLKDADVEIRVWAITGLQNLGPKAAKAMPAIKAALKDENRQVRLMAMQLVATVGGAGSAFLVKQFPNEKDAYVRANLVQIAASSNDRKLALPLLKTAMNDPAAQVRLTTINVLGNFGQESKEAFEIFVLGLKDGDSQVRINAGNLAPFYGQKSWAPLEAALTSAKDAEFRQAILQSLQGTNYRSKTGVTPLLECLKDTDPTVRLFACNVLGNIGPDATNALPQLRELTKDNNPLVQQAAQAAVKRIEEAKK